MYLHVVETFYKGGQHLTLSVSRDMNIDICDAQLEWNLHFLYFIRLKSRFKSF